MPTPKTAWVDRQRETIRRSRIVTRLACFVEEIPDPTREKEGVVKMSANQIRAGLGLLDKVLPSVQVTALVTGDINEGMTESDAIKELSRLVQENPEVARTIIDFNQGKADKLPIESKDYTKVNESIVEIPVYGEKTGESDTKLNELNND